MGAPSTSELLIRPATRADAAACAVIYAPEVRHGTASFETEPPDAAEMARRMGRCHDQGWPWLVAELDGRVVGYAYVTQFRDRPAYRHTAENSIYVAAGMQRRGIGRALFGALLLAARAAGFQQLVAVIGDSDNRASIALHRAMGFQPVGTLSGVGLKFGRRLDVVLLQRGIDEIAS